MNLLSRIMLVVLFIVVKFMVAILILILSALPDETHAQNTKDKKKPKQLTVYARVKDHITHLDIDSAVTATLLSASDSSMVDTVKVSRQYYEGKTYCYAQAKIHHTGRYLMRVEAAGYDPRTVVVDIPKMYRSEVTRELKPFICAGYRRNSR